MSRNYERDERERWRRQQQNRQGQNRWSEGGHEDDYGWSGQGQQNEDWRNDEPYSRDYNRDYNRGQQMGSGSRRSGMQGGFEGTDRDMFQSGGNRGGYSSDRGWDRDRGNESWQGGRGGGWQGDRWQGGGYQSGGYSGGGYQGSGFQGGGYQGGRQGRGWENDYNESQFSPGGNWNERFEGRSQRSNWNQNMGGGGWNPNQETGGWNQGRNENWNQGQNERWNQRNEGWNDRWNQGMRGGNEGQHAGRGPRGFKRADNRIEEDINERLTQHGMIDASDVEVRVMNGEVTLSGHVDRREAKRLAEDVAESIFGVKEVHNQIKVKQRNEGEENKHETDATGKPRERKAG
jgi:hypothetical protein